MATNVSQRLASLTKRLSTFDKVVVTTAGKIIADSVLEQAQRDTHGGRMRNVGKSGVSLDVQITPLSNPVGVRIRPKGKQSGPWTMLSSGTSAHLVAAKKKRGKTSRGRAMRIGSSWHAGPWRAGGTAGKGTWAKGRDAGMDEALTKVRAMFKEVVNDG